MDHAITNARIMTASGHSVTGKCLVVKGRNIEAICSEADLPSGVHMIDMAGCDLLPGFVDLQVNGGGGALFNDDPSIETIRTIARAHQQFGTTAFLPTLISDDLTKIDRAIAAVNDALRDNVPGVAGLHIEGPFLNTDRKGIHDKTKIRPLDEIGLERLQPVIGGKTLVTLAPECMPAAHLRALSDKGIILCAGHTDASFEELTAAFGNGVRGVTHLFNSMSPLTARSPGAVGAALSDPDCWCCVIVDGIHVHPASISLAIRAKGGPERFILVTDAMPTVGQSDSSFTLNGELIHAVGDACVNPAGALAGSNLNMARAVANARSLLGLDLATASRMASAHPAQMIGMANIFGSIAPGLRANLAAIDQTGNVVATWIDGDVVWRAE